MTRLAILADIHGNLPALEAVIDDMARFDVAHVIVAGDVIHQGPFSAQVAARIIDAGWTVIRGNNEFYLLDYGTPRAPAWYGQEPLLGWLCDQLKGRLHMQIAAWPDTLSLRYPDGPPIRVVHGSPEDLTRGFLNPDSPPDDELLVMLSRVEEPVIISGHTHLAMDRRVGRWHLLNPGSVGMPLDGIHTARYMLLESDGDAWEPIFRQVPFDVEAVLREYEAAGFADRLGFSARLFVELARLARPLFFPFFMWRDKHYPGEAPTAAMVDAFLADDWRQFLIGTPYELNMEALQ